MTKIEELVRRIEALEYRVIELALQLEQQEDYRREQQERQEL